MLHKSIQLGLCLSLLSLPVMQQIHNPVRAESAPSNNSSQANSVLPRDTHILITVPYNIGINVKAKESLPTIAVLSAPLYDRHGRQLIPQGATVTITLKPSSSKTGKVYADSIIAGPINIPIKASSAEITAKKVNLENHNHRQGASVQIGHDVGSLLGYALTPSSKSGSNKLDSDQRRLNRSDQYYAIGGLVGGLIDLAAGEETLRLVELKAGHTLALKLEEDAIFYLPTEYPQKLNSGLTNPPSFSASIPQLQTRDNISDSILPSTYPDRLSKNSLHLYGANQLMDSSQSNIPANSSIYRLNGQSIPPATLVKLRSLLAKNYLVEAHCGTIPEQVTIRVNNEFVLCGYPNTKYKSGNYNLTLEEL